MKITDQWLIMNSACEYGINWFNKNYPDGIDHKNLYKTLQAKTEINFKYWDIWLLAHIGGAELAIRCVMRIYTDPSWTQWANDWLSGKDRTTTTALKMIENNKQFFAGKEKMNKEELIQRSAASWAAGATTGRETRAREDTTSTLARVLMAKPDIDLLTILDKCECMKGDKE